MLAPRAEVGSWVSEAAREKFMAAYERAFALWPQPYEEFDVETATATTRVHAYRPHPGGDPVVLLTGAGYNAAGWYPHVAALAGDGPVYGIDMPGDPSPSVLRPAHPAGCLRRLARRTARQAQRPPGPPGRAVLGRLGRHEPGDPRARTGRLHYVARPRRANQAGCPLLVVVHHQRPGHPDPDAAAILTDEELRAITVPTLLIAGARSALLTPKQARTRGSLMPHAEVAIVPGSHGGFDRIDALNARIAAFIRRHRRTANDPVPVPSAGRRVPGLNTTP